MTQNTDTQLSIPQTQALAVYDDLAGQFATIQALGAAIAKSGLIDCKTTEQGTLIAFTCIAERITPLQFMRKYDIIFGRLSQKAASMLADFRSKYGGEFKWIATGDDGKTATLELNYQGTTTTVSYSIEDANRAKLTTSNDNWTKRPGEMLRARATTRGLRMACPEIAAGIYSPEELEDIRATRSQGAATSVVELDDIGELERIFESRESAANEYFASRSWITTEQTFRDLPADRVAKFLANPGPVIAKLDEIIKATEDATDATTEIREAA